MPFSGGHMETGRVLRLIDECTEAGVFDLTLAGGEPLLHPDILEIIERAAAAGMRTGLLTNGVRLTDAMIDALEQRTERRNFIVQVSIDSVDPDVNDVTRGRSREALRNLRAAAASKLDVQVACVISKANVANAHLIIDQLYPSVKRFHFLNIQRTERALSHPELLLDERESRGFWERLNEHRKNFPEDLFLPSLRIQLRSGGVTAVEPEFAVHEEATFACASCSAGWTHINVDADFNMLGCDIAKDYTWMGNLRNSTFRTVWNSREAALVRNSPVPACYQITVPGQQALIESVKPEYQGKSLPLEVLREPHRQGQRVRNRLGPGLTPS
jgi:MoaA/NifB/PqqE/SkfB family radical SAM enzyme